MADEMTLQLEVQDNAAQAAQSLERLAGALESVRDTVRDGLKLTDFSKNLSQLSESVMSAIPESSLLKLERLSTALTSLREAGSVRLDIDPRSTLFQDLSLPEPSYQQPKDHSLSSFLAGLRAQSTGKGIDAFTGALAAVGGAANRAVTGLRPLAETAAAFGHGLLRTAHAGLRSLASGIRTAAGAFGRLQERLSLSNSALGKMLGFFKKMIRGQLVKTIKGIINGFKEGIQNLYKYSHAMGTSFAQAMDAGAAASTRFKNSVAAMLGPVIQASIPPLVSLSNTAVSAADSVNQIFAALTGASVWTHATEEVKDYSKAADSAGKATKGLLADWDELNIIQSQGGGGGGDGKDYTGMFITEALPDNVWTQMASRIKDAVSRGDWYSAGQAIAERINGLIDALKPTEWAEKLNAFLKNALNLTVALLQETDFQALGAKLGAFLTGIFGGNSVNWELLGILLRARIAAVLQTLSGVFETPGLFENIGASFARLANSFFEIDIVSAAKTIAEGVNGAVTAATFFLKKADFKVLGTKIEQGLRALFTGENGIDWAAIGSGLRDGLNGILSSLSALFSADGENAGFFASLGTQFAAMVNGFFTFSGDQKKEFVTTLNNGIKDTIAGVEHFFADTSWEKIGEDIAYWLENLDWGGIAERLWKAIGTIFSAGGKLAGYIGLGIYNAVAKVWNSTFLGGIAHADMFADPDAFTSWFDTGSTEGLVLNDEGYYTKKSSEIVAGFEGFQQKAKETGQSLDALTNDLLTGTNRFIQAVEAAEPDISESLTDVIQTGEAGITDAVDAITSADTPAVPLEIAVEPEAEIDEGPLEEIFKQIDEVLNAYDPDTSGMDADDYWEAVLGPLIEQAGNAAGMAAEAADTVAMGFYREWVAALSAGDWQGSTAGLMQALKDAISAAVPEALPAVNARPLTDSFASAAASVRASAGQMIAAANAVNGISLSAPGGSFSLRYTFPRFAEGGFPTTGSLFVANEAGPEYIGTMGGRTAVANSDQIVSGVASGVAAGQAEQNALLRQQNQLLAQMLNKEFTARAVPGSEWGRFIQQSSSAYARQTGR